MFKNTWQRYRAMRPSLKALVSLFWIQAFTGSLVGIFIQLFLYQKFTSVELNVIATMLFYTGIMIGFCMPGFAASIWRLNVKWGFVLSFFVLGSSLVYLLHVSNVSTAYLGMFLWGIGNGIFWLTVNTFELSETHDEERDFYSSVLNAGNQILSLLGPVCATLLIWLSGSVLHMGTFTLLFTVAPFIYLLGFFSFSRIKDYLPKPIQWADLVHFFADRRNQAAQVYALGMGFQQLLGIAVLPLVTLFILGTALRVGIYNALFAILSALCILVVAQYRTQSNRLIIYGFTTVVLILVTLYLGYALSFMALVIYTIIEGIVSPVMSVSTHVIDLDSMEIGRTDSDFFATMLFRDVALGIWRVAGGLLFLFVMHFLLAEKEFLAAGLYLQAGAFILMYLGAYMLLTLQKRLQEKKR